MKKLATAFVAMALLSGCTLYHNNNENYLPSRNGIQAGETITVKSNENIYTVAKDHNVSMRELIVLNNLKPPFEVKSGQSLTLPATGQSFGGTMPAPDAAPLAEVEKTSIAPIEPAAVSSQSLAPLPFSGPTPASTSAAAPQALAPVASAPSSGTALPPIAATVSSDPVRDLNRASPASQVAPTATTVGPTIASTAAPTAAASSSDTSDLSMIWPVQGPILSDFGPKGPGLNNDGVNIGAPKGAPVAAAAPGTVVYAGNEMKGFGNLVLIRHEGDWVTAYAHLDRVLVKKDTIVGQGDEIGTVGKTGDAASPQLHFETRHAGKPVDPAGVIKDKS